MLGVEGNVRLVHPQEVAGFYTQAAGENVARAGVIAGSVSREVIEITNGKIAEWKAKTHAANHGEEMSQVREEGGVGCG